MQRGQTEVVTPVVAHPSVLAVRLSLAATYKLGRTQVLVAMTPVTLKTFYALDETQLRPA
jgi:hypothetical protein